VTQNMDYFI